MRAWWRLAVVGVCVVVAASCGDNLKPPGGGGQPIVPQQDAGVAIGTIQFATSPEDIAQGKFASGFALHETRGLIAVTGVPPTAGPRVARLEIIGPAGVLVRTRYLAFATDDSVGTEVSHPLSGTPLQVERATQANGMAQLEFGVPLAGTNLARYSITGPFQAAVYLEGSEPVATGTFELRGDQ
jgi:hypothetical protein